MSSIVSPRRTQNLLDSLIYKFASRRFMRRHFSKRHSFRQARAEILKNLMVRTGPFKGMRYPDAISCGSVLVPKLLGCYEMELHRSIEAACQRRYSEIVDIGCAEGYYAVGLAMRIPGAKVYAYDTDKTALEMCQRMAKLNGVDTRVETGGFCSRDTLMQLPVTRRALIVSDCEGYEKELFSAPVIAALANCDLLIETHDCLALSRRRPLRRAKPALINADDCLGGSITRELCKRFENSHHIEIIDNISDIQREQEVHADETRGLTAPIKAFFLSEQRGSTQQWLFLRAKAE